MTSEISSFMQEQFNNGDESTSVPGERPFLFVAPAGESVPEDGVFSYTTIDDLRDLKGLGASTVVLFDEIQMDMLRILCSHQTAFGLDVRSVYGVPGLSYLGWFDDASFGAERQMYGPMVAEIRIQEELNQIQRDQNRSGTDLERARFARKDGSIRAADINVVGAVPEGDDSELE